MMDKMEWLFVGLAALFELVLFLLLRQPINRKYASSWLKWLVAGATLFHIGYLGRLIVSGGSHSLAISIDRLSMTILCLGLLIMPSSMLHAAIRLWWLRDESIRTMQKRDWRYGLLYLPLLMLIPAIYCIASGSEGDFMESVRPVQPYFMTWLTMANTVCAILFLAIALRTRFQVRKTFFLWMSLLLTIFTAGAGAYIAYSDRPAMEYTIRLLMAIAPLLPSVLLVGFVLKNRLLPVVFEQTTIYGGIVLSLLIVHQVLIYPFSQELKSWINVDLILIETAIVACVVYWIRPLRQRASESLRFLLSPTAFSVRDATRRLALEVTQQSEGDLDQRCQWFAEQLRSRFDLTWVRVVREAPSSSGPYREYYSRSNSEGEFASDRGIPKERATVSQDETESVRQVTQWVRNMPEPLERGQSHRIEVEDAMEALECDVAFPMNYMSIQGAVLFGNDRSFTQLANEQITSLLVLIDQFAATLQNQQDESLRRTYERQSFQQEKLSALGMVSGTLAHELRNPLSSIRTIATLLSEETAAEHPHSKDLQLIITEVDRLHTTLQRVLDFARPSDEDPTTAEPERVLARIGGVMNYFALEHGVKLDFQCSAGQTFVLGSDHTLSEVFMNLLKNAIEACSGRSDATVSVRSMIQRAQYVAIISDNGPGIPEADQSKVFQPFFTGKETGTGLGLYIVRERVSELHGSIQLRSKVGVGTEFQLTLPLATKQ